MRPVLAEQGFEFWVAVGVGVAFVVWLLGRIGWWLWMAARDRLRNQLTVLLQETRSNAVQANARANVAAQHAIAVTKAVGVPNGGGDLTTMVERLLEEVASINAEVSAIKAHLDLS